jgi:hypothetical protein
LTAVLAERTDPFTSRTLKAVALATYEPIGWRVRGKFGHRIEDGIGVVAQISRVTVAQIRDMGGQRVSIVRFAAVLQAVGGTKRQHPMYKWRKVFVGNRTSPQRRDVVAKASPQLCQTVVRDLELNLLSDVTTHVGEFELDYGIPEDQPIGADLSEKADVKDQGAQAVVAVGHANEGAEYVRATLRRYEAEIERRRIVYEVYAAMPAG